MGRELSIKGIHIMLRELELFAEGDRLLIVGASGDDVASAPAHNVIRLGRVACAEDVCETTRVNMSIVIDQIEHMSKDHGAQLLSRLRDLISYRVLLVLRGKDWASDELLALGYQEIKRPSGDGRYFLSDPDQFHQPRTWNNASGWAHPENYGKFRW